MPAKANLITPKLADALDPAPMDPLVKWTWYKRQGFMWSKQREVADSVVANRFTAVKSAHGTGKSWLAADIVAWWLDQHPIGTAFAVTTAPTAPQVEAILWREISVAKEEARLKGRITWGQVPTWKIGDRMIGYGRKPADYSDPNKAMQAFQGIHAQFVLVILDEACGIPVWLWNAVDSLATNDDARVLAIGNPDDPSSEFQKICQPGQGWNVLTISAFDLPCYTGEKIPDALSRSLTGKKWVEERKRKWGEGSPLYQSKVLGEFPDVSDDSLVTPRMVREAQERVLSGIEVGSFGGDVARFGQDRSVLYRNRGGSVRKVGEWAKQGTMKTTGHFAKALIEVGSAAVMYVDVVGVGGGVYDRLAEQGFNVMPFQSQDRPYDVDRFYDRRSEVYWGMRELFEVGDIDIDPLDDDLAAQLTSIKWKVTSNGKIQVESKEDMRKRGLPSPDHADACMMSTAGGTFVPMPNDVGAGENDYTSDLLGRPM